MTKEQALKFKAEYLGKGARDFTNPSHFDLDPSGFFEPHVEVVKIERDNIHSLKGGTLSLKKETVDRIAQAAGISFRDLPVEKHVRGEPYIGRCQPITQGPDGQPIIGDVAIYEFDPELRAEQDILLATEKAQEEGRKYQLSDTQRRLKVLDYEKSGSQRANTGARSRATIAAIGMQTGFKDLFKGKETECFLFSRVIINVKNKMVAEMQLLAISGNAKSLYGPQPGTQRQIRQADPEPDDAFTDDAPEVEGFVDNDDPREAYRQSLRDMQKNNRDILPTAAHDAIDAALSNKDLDIDSLQGLVRRILKTIDLKTPAGGVS